MENVLYAAGGVLLIAIIIWALRYFSPVRVAGRKGEKAAKKIISTVLRKGDILLNNVELNYEGKKTELDNVIVNKYGVFIIEVKNYSGRLEGGEDDFEWKKYHTTRGGNVYEKTAKNPIKQVKRQTYILAHTLEKNKLKAWIEGFVYLIENNSPVKSPMVLGSVKDIDRAIHTSQKQPLSDDKIKAIVNLLK